MLKVLLVDDDSSELLAFQVVLQSFGFDVAGFSNGKDALESLQHSTPDLVITDMVMPDMDGFELIKLIRALHQDVPILALSGIGPREGKLYLSMAAKLGANSIQTKPLNSKRLLAAINNLLGNAATA